MRQQTRPQERMTAEQYTAHLQGKVIRAQVDVDHDEEELVHTSSNTWLAQTDADDNESSETLSLQVFENNANGTTKIVDVADVPNIVDVTEDQFVLVNMSKKENAQGEGVAIADP